MMEKITFPKHIAKIIPDTIRVLLARNKAEGLRGAETLTLGFDAGKGLVKEPEVPTMQVRRFKRRDWQLIPMLATLASRR